MSVLLLCIHSTRKRTAYSSGLRREATAAESAANPAPKRTTVIGSGIGTGPGIGVAVSVGAEVTITVGVLVGPTGVSVGGGVLVFVGVAVSMGVAVGVAVGCSVTVVSTAGACAETTGALCHPDANVRATNNAIVVRSRKWLVKDFRIAMILLNG